MRLALRGVLVVCLLTVGWAWAQEASDRTDAIGGGPLAQGTAITQDLETAHLLRHLELWGWSFALEADAPFDRVSVALVAMTRVHLDEPFTRTVVGGGLTVERPEPSSRADVTVVLDAADDPRALTLAVDGSSSRAETTLPAPLTASADLVSVPFGRGLVLETDPDGRFLLVKIYPDSDRGVVATGETADMLAYLAVEISVE